MATAVAEAHITAQARLRTLTVQGVATTWATLPNHDEGSVARFLAFVVPLVLAAQRQSVALTNAFLARSLGRSPVNVNVQSLVGAAIRNGTPPEVVYRRPFVQTWAALKNGTSYADAVHAAGARIEATAAMDVQNAMRHTLRAVGDADPRILGYKRVPDATACPFCTLIAGRLYHVEDLQPVHAHCGCGVDIITSKFRPNAAGNVSRDGVTAAVRDHGELGPLLVNGADHFTGLDALAA